MTGARTAQPRRAWLRSGELAAAAGVHVETLRYYERRGLLAAPDRTSGGHRLYPAETVTVVTVIKAAQRLGFTLDEIADLLDLGRHHHGSGPGRQRHQRHRKGGAGLQDRVQEKLAEVDERIADLQVIRATLVAALEAGCDDLVACAATDGCPIPFSQMGSAARA